MSVQTSLWRAIAALRVLALGYALVLFLHDHSGVVHPSAAVALLAAMSGWTAVVVALQLRASSRGSWVLLGIDLGVAVCAVIVSGVVQGAELVSHGAQTLPVLWPAAAVVAWGLQGGWRAGVAAAGVVSAAGVVERQGWSALTVHNIVLLLVAGFVVGYAGALVRESERQLAVAVRLSAATRERERLGRVVHDGVLQILALVARTGVEASAGEAQAAERFGRLARLAGEQEVALRALVATPFDDVHPLDRGIAGAGVIDLRPLLTALASGTVTVSTPGLGVPCEAGAAHEVTAAVAAALDNVARHAGPTAHAWVLLEDEGDTVVVSVRDDGVGFDPDIRLPQARAAGRMGVASSLRGRLLDLGGSVDIVSGPGRGTEVELRLPRGVRS